MITKRSIFNMQVVDFLKRMSHRLKIPASLSSAIYMQIAKQKLRPYKKLWLIKNGTDSYFDINGAKLPDVSSNPKDAAVLVSAFEDVFLIPCFYKDNHDKAIVEKVDKFMIEGPYGYADGKFDVTVKKNDIVIDAGAWIGDFSAYAASKGATVYAFEPVKATFNMLCKTKELNNVNGGADLPCTKRTGQQRG